MRVWLLVGAGLLLAGCADRQPLSVTERDTIDACRARAGQVYDRLHRADIYSIPQTGLPYSANGSRADITAGLATQYSHDEMVDRCERNTGAGTLTVGPNNAPPGKVTIRQGS